MNISTLSEHCCHLGEGPLWDHRDQALYWVDSFGPTLYRFDFSTSEVRHWHLDGHSVGSLAVRESGGLILAMDQGIYSFDLDTGETLSIAQPLAGRTDLRLNDGKVDPFGAYVTGAMNIDFTRSENCSMYRLTPDLVLTDILDGFDCFNGPCFSPDGERVYLTGRQTGVIEQFDYAISALPTNPRILRAQCNPDGATVDAEGFIWSAQWDDASVLRLTPDGEVDQRIEFPGQIVSSVMFGGPQLDILYLTTVGAEVHGVSPAASKPGRVLVVEDSGFQGRPEPMFKG